MPKSERGAILNDMRLLGWIPGTFLLLFLWLVPINRLHAADSALTLFQLSAEDRGLLQTAGMLGVRSPDLGDRSFVYNSKTGQDLTAQELARIKKELRPGVSLGPVQGPFAPPNESKETKELSSALERGARGENIFEPMGPFPSDYSGYSLKGPALPGDGARVLRAGKTQVGVDLSAHNFLTKSDDPGGRVTQKFEDHRVQLNVRRGLNTSVPLEVGASIQVHNRDEGFMNGFIAEAEKMLARGFGPDMINDDRIGPHALKGTINDVTIGGKTFNDNATSGLRFGGVVLAVKAALSQPPPGSYIPTLAARAAVMVSAPGPFSNGSSLGVGVSVMQRLFGNLYAHGDARVTVPLESNDSRGLAYAPANAGGSIGLEYGFTDRASAGLQFNYQQSAYKDTGMHPFDDNYADVTFGFNYRLANVLAHDLIVQFWGKEDVNLNPRGKSDSGLLGPHGDSDFAAGIGLKSEF